jgi:endoglucanase Acf2
MRRILTRVLPVAVAAALLPACASVPGVVSGPGAADAIVLGDAQVSPLVSGLVERTPKPLPVARLADGLTPPTNRWYSGLVFGDTSQPVFPMPLSFALTDGGFAFGLPTVTATADTIAGGYSADVPVSVGAASSVVTSDDAVVVTIAQRDASGAEIGKTTIGEGWPFVGWTATRATEVQLPQGLTDAGDGVYTFTAAGKPYALKLADAQLAGAKASVAAGGSLVFWPVAAGHQAGDMAGLAGIPSASKVAYDVGAQQVTTTLSYTGAGAVARMPHQGTADGCDLGTFASVYGTMTVCRGSELAWNTARQEPKASLDLGSVQGAHRSTLTEALTSEASADPKYPQDTYFGGKALQREAMLLMVADQLGEKDVATKLATSLDAQLTAWTQPQGCTERDSGCFVYDPKGKGIVGLTPSFGSDEYNDHHFHYGYFLYAAAVMARHDPSTAARYAPVMNLLAADIASSGSTLFPDRRNFDPYAGHSWASGTSPFADGNNQESVSEAVNAYAGLGLWARATGDSTLQDEADWMLSLEAASSTAYWTNADLSQPEYTGYAHKITALNWGGKRDYATWFSPASAAKLGILLLPMSPSSAYLAGDPERIRANVTEAVGTDFDTAFGDYLLMYSALAGGSDRDRAIAAAEQFPADKLDDGMSRTYLLAWLYSLTG